MDTDAFKDFYNNAWLPAAAAYRANDDTQATRILVDKFGGAGSFDRMMPAAREIAMQNARFFRAATLSRDHSPDIDKEKVRRLKIPVLLINGERTGSMQRLIVEEIATCDAIRRTLGDPRRRTWLPTRETRRVRHRRRGIPEAFRYAEVD